MHDLVIRRGTVIDGTGAERIQADVAIEGDRIVAVGPNLGAGRREIDAHDKLVTPGWVDIHTHYDGQATWDPSLTPSCWHGVTTAVMGNCGVGFAPVRPGTAPALINLMEGIEDIPGTVLSEGVAFDWETFPEYLDVLKRTPKDIDLYAQVPHAALRFYVMGDRGLDHAEAPTDDEIARMGVLLEEALLAGAVGFTTARTTKHKAADGRMTPSLTASDRELLGLGLAMKRAGRGVLEVNSDFGPGEFDVLEAVTRASGRPLSVLIVQFNSVPERWRDTRDRVHAARKAGLDVTMQVGTRPIGMMMGLETTIHPFSSHPAWLALRHLTPRERFDRLMRDADLRRTLVEVRPTDEHTQMIAEALSKTYVLDAAYDYEPETRTSLAARAQATGANPWQLALDAMLEDEGRRLLTFTFENYAWGDLEAVREMMDDPWSVIGLGDSGAHVCTICDSSAPTFLLTHWARDRKRGPKLPLEFLLHKQTQASAASYGFHDRGVLAPGMRADVNVIDFDRLAVTPHELVYDLPAGGKRLVQSATGYVATIAAGRVRGEGIMR
jgi:N-acyl-D-aspartate/D-glutamate deacylase